MRTHALYNRDKRTLTLTLGTGLIILGISGVYLFAECYCFSLADLCLEVVLDGSEVDTRNRCSWV